MRFNADAVRDRVLPIYVNGDWRESTSDPSMASIAPTTGEEWYRIADCTDCHQPR